MTRFNLTLDQGIKFVIDNLARMKGGETFVSKIPSFHVTDLAKALAPNLPLRHIGIRPGEKLHEVMCTVDDASHTLEFDDHFVITPSIIVDEGRVDYTKNKLGQSGRLVPDGFEYNSGNNPHFLTLDELKAAINSVS